MADHVAHALEDGVVTDTERADLDLAARLVGIETARVDEMVDAGVADATGLALAEVPRGATVHFTLPLISTVDGQPLDMARAAAVARDKGLTVSRFATKRCDLLVAADVEALGLFARRRRGGTRLMVERSFWRALGVRTD